MSAFEYFSVALSFVLGLGVTRLLLGGVHVFRARRRQRVHWIPLVWAAGIFVYQIQFWWALFELNEVLAAWTHIAFVTLMAHALLLFVAGALVLPTTDSHERESLIGYFEGDGHWALLAIAVYTALSYWTNWALFGTSPLSSIGLIVAVSFVLPLGGFFVSNRTVNGALAAAYLVFVIYAYVVLAPAQY